MCLLGGLLPEMGKRIVSDFFCLDCFSPRDSLVLLFLVDDYGVAKISQLVML